MPPRFTTTLYALSLLSFLIVALPVFGVEISNPIDAQSFEDLIRTIARFATMIVGPIAVLMILYAGVLFMTSAGNVERVKKARQALIWALVGLAVVLIGEGFIAIIKDILK